MQDGVLRFVLDVTAPPAGLKLLVSGEGQSAQAPGSRVVRVASGTSAGGLIWACCAKKMPYLLLVDSLVHPRDAAPNHRDVEYRRTVAQSVQ